MKVAEIYRSVQGEGLLTGADSVFVRASGCNLRCWYCDTPYASWQPEGRDLTVDEILAACEEWDANHIVITGGEPMLFAEMIPLTRLLAAAGRHITIETAGTLYLPVECHLMSLSPKLSNSTPPADRDARWRRRHERTRHTPQIVARLMREYTYQLKFVVDSPADGAEVLDYLCELETILAQQSAPQSAALDRSRVLLMPQGTDPAALARHEAWLPSYCEKHSLAYCPRKHIEWFGLVRGT